MLRMLFTCCISISHVGIFACSVKVTEFNRSYKRTSTFMSAEEGNRGDG